MSYHFSREGFSFYFKLWPNGLASSRKLNLRIETCVAVAKRTRKFLRDSQNTHFKATGSFPYVQQDPAFNWYLDC